MAYSVMSDCLIVKVVYVGKTEELYIKFSKNIVPSYNCACFINVPFGTAKRFSEAQDKEQFFEDNIRKQYRYYCTDIAFGEVLAPPEDFEAAQDWQSAKNDWMKSHAMPEVDTPVNL